MAAKYMNGNPTTNGNVCENCSQQQKEGSPQPCDDPDRQTYRRSKVQELRQQYQQLQHEQMLKQQQFNHQPKSRPRVHFKDDLHQKHLPQQDAENQQYKQHHQYQNHNEPFHASYSGHENSRSPTPERQRYSSKTLMKSHSIDGYHQHVGNHHVNTAADTTNTSNLLSEHQQQQAATPGTAAGPAVGKVKRRRGIHRSYSEVGDSSTALRCRAILRSHSVFLEVRLTKRDSIYRQLNVYGNLLALAYLSSLPLHLAYLFLLLIMALEQCPLFLSFSVCVFFFFFFFGVFCAPYTYQSLYTVRFNFPSATLWAS